MNPAHDHITSLKKLWLHQRYSEGEEPTIVVVGENTEIWVRHEVEIPDIV